MKKAVLTVALIVVIAVTAAGQGRGSSGNQPVGQYAIRGRLVFPTAKQPEDRIEVILERNMQRIATTFTDSLGQFEFGGLTANDYQVVLHVPDYEDINQVVTIFASQMNTIV